MPSRLDARLRRLEARRPPVAAPPYTPPEPPPGWHEEVLQLLWDSGHLRLVLEETFQLPLEEVAWLMALAEHDFPALVATFEETPADALTT
jgi:hypothetical protein